MLVFVHSCNNYDKKNWIIWNTDVYFFGPSIYEIWFMLKVNLNGSNLKVKYVINLAHSWLSVWGLKPWCLFLLILRTLKGTHVTLMSDLYVFSIENIILIGCYQLLIHDLPNLASVCTIEPMSSSRYFICGLLC